MTVRESALRCALLALAATAPGVATLHAAIRPMVFEQNAGQAAEEVDFIARGRGYSAGLGATGIWLPIKTSIDACSEFARVRFLGADPQVQGRGEDRLPGVVNQFMGNDPRRWRRGAPTWQRVVYTELYPGIDLVFHGRELELEHDFIVAAGASVEHIKFVVEGATARIGPAGELVLESGAGSLAITPPVAWQDGTLGVETVASRFINRGQQQFGIAVGSYDRRRPLTVDPIMDYSSYFGGTAADANPAITVDSMGRVLIAGVTNSTDFPIVGTGFPAGGGADAFLSRFSADGQTLEFSTYYGGSGEDQFRSIVIDPSGNLYLGGYTTSTDFPQVKSLQAHGGGYDAILVNLDPGGSTVLFSSYLGGSGVDLINGTGQIAVDATGMLWAQGMTTSTDFPVRGAAQAALGGREDTFVVKADTIAGALVYATYLGGSVRDDADALLVDATGSVFVAGRTLSADFPIQNALQPLPSDSENAFVARLNPLGDQLEWSTFFGGSQSDAAYAMCFDGDGNIVVAGTSSSADFPLKDPVQALLAGGKDAFISVISADGTALLKSTFWGGNRYETAYAVAVDALGDILFAGTTTSDDFPQILPLQAVPAGQLDVETVFVAALAPGASAPVYSSYIGGTDYERPPDIAVTATGDMWLAAGTFSDDYPVIQPWQAALAGSLDVVLTHIACQPPPDIANRLMLAKASAGVLLGFRFLDAPGASGYRIYQDPLKTGSFATATGSAPAGRQGLDIPMPTAALEYYRAAGFAACGEGPR